MILFKLRSSLEKTLDELRELNKSVVDGEGKVRSFTEEEQARFEALESQAQATRDAIEREEKRSKDEEIVERLGESEERQAPRVQVVRDENEDENGEYRGFKSLGEQLRAVFRAEKGQVDRRLDQVRAAAGHNETVGSEGGFLLQKDFISLLQKEALASSSVASLCSTHPVSSQSNSVSWPVIKETSRADGSRYGGVQGYWLSEAGSLTASQAEFELNELRLEKLGCLAYVTDEMLEDAAFLGSFLQNAYREEIGFKLDTAILEGDGAGKPQGILNHASLVAVAKKSSQTAGTVVADNIAKMWSRLIPSAKRRAVWLANYEVEAQLPLMTIGDQPVYIPAGGLTGQPHATLLGRPVIVVEACEKLGDQGDIVLADMSKYLLAQKGGIQGDVSIHVKFSTGESAFRFFLRVNGQPMIANAVTPYKGTSGQKLSYFVTVAARA